MPGPEMETVLRNGAKICSADIVRAYLHPAKEFGSLRRYINVSILMEPSRTFVISRSGRDNRTPNDEAAMNLYAELCGDALGELQRNDPAAFNQAVEFINGAGLKDAEAFLASPR